MQPFRWLALVTASVAALAAPGRGDQPAKADKPDLIVSDLRPDGDAVVLEVQNQGPGTAKKGTTVEAVVSGFRGAKVRDAATGKVKVASDDVSVTVTVPVPADVLATEAVKIPLAKFGVTDPAGLSPLLTVTLDPKNALAEEREGNNSYARQLDFAGRTVDPPRGDYKGGAELPDLVITDVTQDGPHLVVHYANRGKGATGADFLVSVKAGKAKYDGNRYYRFRVPAPGTEAKSGGITLGLIKLSRGDEAEIEATIDPEDRVREADKTNNVFRKKVTVK